MYIYTLKIHGYVYIYFCKIYCYKIFLYVTIDSFLKIFTLEDLNM